MNHKLVSIIGILLMLASSAFAEDIIVSPGDSLAKARDQAKSGDRIILHGGTYRLNEPLVIGPRNSGVTWMAVKDEKPVLSGGELVTGWMPDVDGVWKAQFKHPEKLRQLYVNGKFSSMAKYKKQVTGQGFFGEFVIQGNEPWAFKSGKEMDGILFKKTDLPIVAHPEDLEILFLSTWTTCRLCVRGIQDQSDSRALLFEQPFAAFSVVGYAGQYPFFNIHDDTLFNAREFLTASGEFCFDRSTQMLYYKPRKGEDMTKAQVVAPNLETLVKIQGVDLKTHVSHVGFEGITFAHTAWQLMRIGKGHGEVTSVSQSNALLVKYGGNSLKYNSHDYVYQTMDLPTAAVEVNSADHVSFDGNTFTLTGCMGLNFENDVVAGTIKGNVFRDIGEAAINVGHPQHVYIGKQNGDNEGHGPYHIDNSGDKWPEGVEGLCTDILITNNLIRNTGMEHLGSTAVMVYFANGMTIRHNDIAFAPYTGISMGWGWNEWCGYTARSLGKPSLSLRNTEITCNKIGYVLQTLHDGGGIYLLAQQTPTAKDPARQEWTRICGNYLYNFGGSNRNGIHPDEGSKYFLFQNNVFNHISGWLISMNNYGGKGNFRVENNYADTPLLWGDPLAPNISFKTNVVVTEGHWPAEARKIMDEAGLEPEYRKLLETLEPSEADIQTSASDSYINLQPNNLISTIGLDANDHHENVPYPQHVWSTNVNPPASAPAPGLAVCPAWVRFDFAKAKPMDTLLIWNSNEPGYTSRGFRQVKIYGTTDGNQWTLLAEVELKQAGGLTPEAAQTVPLHTGGKPLRSVIICAQNNYGGNIYGLSKVRFITGQR